MIGFWRTGHISTAFSIYGWGMIIYLIIKMSLSIFYRVDSSQPPYLKVSVIIPFYNESKEALLKLLEGLSHQTYPIEEIFIIDDGSLDDILDNLMLDAEKNFNPVFLKNYEHINCPIIKENDLLKPMHLIRVQEIFSLQWILMEKFFLIHFTS